LSMGPGGRGRIGSLKDLAFMRRAIALAERGRGRVGANPLVGAVVVRGGRIVGEGWHAAFGRPHAEPAALAAAGNRARGAAMYVTLEPCGKAGKTPPCSRAIVAAGVKRVVFGLADPSAGGRGVAELKRRGIEVRGGLLGEEVARQNVEFLEALRMGRPHLTLKMAMTLDGRTADFRGRSKWISSAESRRFTRALRGRVDAVMVGAGTLREDDPRLNSPGAGGGPLKVIVDSRAALRPGSRVFSRGRVLVAHAAKAPAARLNALRLAGAQTLGLRGKGGRVDLRRLLDCLYAMGVGTVLCEGGSELAGELWKEKLVDRLVIAVSPAVLGGKKSLPLMLLPDTPLGRSRRVEIEEARLSGPDVMISARTHFPKGRN